MIKISSKIWGFYLMFWRCPVSTYCIVSGSNMSGSNERTFLICQLLFTRLIFVVSCLLFCFCLRIFRAYGDVILVGKGLLDARGLCTRRDLYRATPAVTRTSVFGVSSEGPPLFSHLLRQGSVPRTKCMYLFSYC